MYMYIGEIQFKKIQYKIQRVVNKLVFRAFEEQVFQCTNYLNCYR